MSGQLPRRPIQRALLAVVVVPPIAFFSAISWLKGQSNAMVFLFAGIASTLVVVGSLLLSVMADRQLDEWHRSAARFSNQWGWNLGAGLVALLLALPPVHDLVVAGAGRVTRIADPDRTLVLIAFTFGFVGVVLAQAVCTLLLNVGWRYWMSRAGHETA